ncbi:MAG: xanthine dehydrogenase family protein molybdopterin-binding subunit [Thermoplasmata archaeon]|nr:xanthine dehydrogenase family protein molybdopterin-binding subunit [Thermoplasmata archaeon]MCI4362284.1 xanthine dehydrogenase family protein molybdopterin-binding subunit [Thermoplasmata archaeon]
MTRSDAALKSRGGAEYGLDLETHGMLHGVLVPSPVASGVLRSIDLSAARTAPGVVVAVGPAELAALLPNGGDAERPVFPRSRVMYRNQPVAAVAARTLAEARAAARLVRVDVTNEPPLIDLEERFPEWPASLTSHDPAVVAHVVARHGDLAAAFRTADLVHSETYRTSGIEHVALEPHACLAVVRDGTWHVTTTTQTPFGVREDAAEILGIPQESLVVEGTWVGGGFGSKGAAFLEPYALLLAAAAGRPVRLAFGYRDEFQVGRSTLPAVIRLDTAVRNGTITARRVRLLLDTGASLPGRDFATGYSIGFLLGPYRIPAFEMEGYAIRTNKPPFGPHRAPFAPQCVFAIDSHTDGLARRLGVDPVEFRLRHVWREGDRTPLDQPVGPFGAAAALELAHAKVAAWRRTLPAGTGIGVGIGFWSTSTGAGGEVRLRLTATELVVEQAEHEIGSGSIVRGLVAVVERYFGLPADRVRVTSPSTATAPFDSGVFGSRTVAALGKAVEAAGEKLLETLATRARASGPVRLEFDGRRLLVVSGRTKVPVSELLQPDEREGGLVAEGRHYGRSGAIDASRVVEGTFYPYTDFTASVHVAAVSVDRETGSVKVLRYAAFQDIGTVLDAGMFRGQVEGGVAMGLGTALTEESLWAPDGRMANPGLLDYRIPTIAEIPPIEVVAVEGFLGAGPFGAKGLGEPPIIPVPAAVANAVADATGARVTELPLTPERVARALKLL